MPSSSPPTPAEIIKHRWLGFLIWQSIAGALIYLLTPPFSFTFSPLSLLSFLLFSLSLLLLSISLFLLSSPHPDPAAPVPLLFSFLLRSLLRSLVGGFSGPADTADVRRRVRRSLVSAAFLTLCGVSGFLAVVVVCGRAEMADWGRSRLAGVGLRGLVLGLVYGAEYIWRSRWILRFPVVQRFLFYSFKRGLASSVQQALRLSIVALLCSTVLMIILPDQFKRKRTLAQSIGQLVYFYVGTSAVCICWELSHHLLQVYSYEEVFFCTTTGICCSRNKSK